MYWAPGRPISDFAAILLITLLYEADSAAILLLILLYETDSVSILLLILLYEWPRLESRSEINCIRLSYRRGEGGAMITLKMPVP